MRAPAEQGGEDSGEHGMEGMEVPAQVQTSAGDESPVVEVQAMLSGGQGQMVEVVEVVAAVASSSGRQTAQGDVGVDPPSSPAIKVLPKRRLTPTLQDSGHEPSPGPRP